MQKHPDLTRSRLRAFIARGWLNKLAYPQRAPVGLSVFSAPGRISFAEAMEGEYRLAQVGEQFGPVWSTHWFKIAFAVPRDWRGEVHLLWDSSSEACVWRDGVPVQGLTGTRRPGDGAGPIRTECAILSRARGGERGTIFVEMACNQIIVTEGMGEFLGKLRQAEIARFDPLAWELLWDFHVIAEMAQHLPHNSPRAAQALYAANEMLNCIELDDPSTWSRARAVAARFLGERNGGGQHRISAIGHAHIDTAWFWPLAETKRKCVRTFSTALRNMERYLEYRFACSQAQQFEWIKHEHPALYEQLRLRVKEGRFIPVGGMWVETDCNLPSGESLVRQLLYGQRFFRREFGITCREGWLPDVFGYNGQMPQLLSGAGMRYFLTQKLSWNQFNKPVSHTFWWEGIDGSRVLAHFPPADTYNGVATVQQLRHAVENYKELDRSNESIYLFGYGDGGGGPTREMIERLRRAHDVDGLPRVEMRPPEEAFKRIEADARALTTHVGEMYFENHRATYTSQALVKRNNRRSEEMLHDAELLAAVAPGAYPAEELERLWKIVLVNQFHDIIPGSSIAEVYREAEEQYAEVLSAGAALRDKAIAALGFRPGKCLLAVNTLSAPRREVVELPGPRRRLGIVEAPAMGCAVQAPVARPETPATIREAAGRITMENALVRAIFRRDGALVSLFDKRAGREAISGAANRFVIFGHEPLQYDAWNVEAFHLEKRREIVATERARIVARNPLRVAAEFRYRLSPRSTLRQIVSLDALSARLDFACEADWHERDKFLKVEFPTALRSDYATYEIPFGHLRRATHFNTPHDLARFESPAHRWADLSEPGFGLALLNDCKYGYAVHGSTMRLSLLTATKYPDPDADMGRHAFRYAILPHPSSFQEAGVAHEAQRFNTPLILRQVNAEPGALSWFSAEPAGVIVDTVKKAEDSDALIVRLYEAHGARTRARLRSALPVRVAARCNLLEEPEEALPWRDGSVTLELGPFQVATLHLSLLRQSP